MTPHVLCPSCGAAILPGDEEVAVCTACAFALALDSPDREEGAVAVVTPETDTLAAIGSYSLLERIGEGGMGEVWRAEQTEPVKRIVALKLIKRGMDTRQFIARFEAERQALALMDHACISRVFDAGTTGDGRPYFVMEYVSGLPITEHCDRNMLTTRERIELFIKVCDSVQHAHQKAILHRDLKPSNIIVSLQGGVAVPKIIDFGVAKAMGRSLTADSLHTEFGILIGTPEYMSPEQADPLAVDVDTRADVYALGVILYELLTSALPFESKELRRAGSDAIRRTIREVDPPTPSARLTTLGGERSSEAARHRAVDLPTLRRQLKGELDWITMKALEKDRGRRYGSPAELALDLARSMRNEPVVAGPPSAAYRARKFVRRHRLGVVLGATATVALLGWGVERSVQSARIAREAEGKRRVSEFLTRLFEVSDPGETRGSTITARELLDKGAASIRENLAEDPTTRAELMGTMGIVYRNLGMYPQADPLIVESLKAERELLGARNVKTLRMADETAALYLAEGHVQDAETLVRETLETQRRVLGREDPDTLQSMSVLAAVSAAEGRHKEAEALCRETLELRRRVLGPNHADTVRSMSALAREYFAEGRLKDAEALFRETIDTAKRVLGPGHPDAFKSMTDLTAVYVAQGREKDAEALIRESFETSRRVLGPEHPDTLRAMAALARSASVHSRFQEAEALIHETMEIQKRVLGPDHADTVTSMFNLATTRFMEGYNAEAETLYREVLQIRKRVLGPEHLDTLRTMAGLANTISAQGRYAEAEALFRETLAIQKRVLGPEHPKTLYMMSDISGVVAAQGHYQEAEALARETLEIQKRVLGPDSPDTLVSVDRLATACSGQGRYQEAEALLRDTLETSRKTLGPEHPYTLQWMIELAEARASLGRYSDAETLQREALEIRKRTLGPSHPQTIDTTYGLARTAMLGKKRTEALRSLRDAVEHGYADAKKMQEDASLRGLHGDPEFERIVARARANQGRTAGTR